MGGHIETLFFGMKPGRKRPRMGSGGFSKFWIRIKDEVQRGEGPDRPGGNEEDDEQGQGQQNRKADPEKKGAGRVKKDHGHHDKGEPGGGDDAKGDDQGADENPEPGKKPRNRRRVEVIGVGFGGRGNRRKPRGRSGGMDWLNWHHRTRR